MEAMVSETYEDLLCSWLDYKLLCDSLKRMHEEKRMCKYCQKSPFWYTVYMYLIITQASTCNLNC